MIIYIYISTVILIILITIILLANHNASHNNELRRISLIEERTQDTKNRINSNRLKTQKCHISDLNSPRECYFASNYKCKWNIDADRCNKF